MHLHEKILFVFLGLLLLIPALPVSAQALQVERREFELEREFIGRRVSSLGPDGLIYWQRDRSSKKGAITWFFNKLSVSLDPVWERTAEIPKKFHIVSSQLFGDQLYVLFSKGRKKKSLLLLHLDTQSGEISRKTWGVEMSEIKDNFEVYGEELILLGRFKKSRRVARLPLNGNEASYWEPIKRREGYFNELYVNAATGALELIYADYRDKEQPELVIEAIAGPSSRRIVLQSPEKGDLKNGRTFQLPSGEEMVIGTWSRPRKSGAQGLFTARVNGETVEFLKLYSFTDFENQFEYLSEQKQKRVEKKIQRKEKKGKDLKLAYRFLIHDLFMQDGNVVFIGEAFYPEYHTESYLATVRGPNGSMQTTTKYRSVFDGWRYTHAVVAGFDAEGNLVWDNIFEVWDILTFRLKRRIKVTEIDGDMNMMYNYGSSLKTKVIRGNEVIEGKEYVEVETEKEGDKVKRSWGKDTEYWYDNHFIAFGTQKIKNKEDDQKKRRVFYLTKVSFEE